MLIGRDEQSAVLSVALSAAADGAGGVLLVLGEAGVGKTRLLAAAVEEARDLGMHVLLGRATEHSGAYRPVAEALLRAGSTVADLSEVPALQPYRATLARLLPGWDSDPAHRTDLDVDPALVLGEGVAELLTALATPTGCVVVLEDLHWADLDTLSLVSYLAGRLEDLPVLVIASARDDEPGSQVRRLAVERSVRRLAVPRLSPDPCAELARNRAAGRLTDDRVVELAALSEGLPLLVEELVDEAIRGTNLRSDSRGSPPALMSLVRRRLEVLEPSQQRCLEVAAVTGTEPDWTLMPAAADQPEHQVLAAARAAVGAGLLREHPDGVVWRHALIREAVRSGLLAPERAALSVRVANALLARGRSDDGVRAAELLAAGGETERAAALFLTLARDARHAGSLGLAATLLDHAEVVGGNPGSTGHERVLLLTWSGRMDEAVEAGTAALAWATGDLHSELCLAMARAAIGARRWVEAGRLVERAGRPEDLRSSLLSADAASGAGDVVSAERLVEDAVERAEATGSPVLLCEALDIAARIRRLHDPEQAEAAFRRMLQVASEHRLILHRVTALLGLGTLELLRDEASMSPSLREAAEVAGDFGLVGLMAAAQCVELQPLCQRDGPIRHEQAALAQLALAKRLRLPEVHAHCVLAVATARAATGDLEGMEATLARFPVQGDWMDLEAQVASVRALPLLLDHDLRGANAMLDPRFRALVSEGTNVPWLEFGLWALLRTAVDDRGAEARRALAALPALQRRGNRGALAYAEAIAAGRAGRVSEAVSLFEVGDADLAGLAWTRRCWRLLVLRSCVVDGWGDPVPHLRHDLAEHEHHGDLRFARICRDLLRQAGAPVRRRRGGGTVPPALRAQGVTSREMEVLALVSGGLTNAQIAEQLVLSPRTVETHVGSLLAKLDAADRHELRKRHNKAVSGWHTDTTPMSSR